MLASYVILTCTNLSRLCLWTTWFEQGWIQKEELRAISRSERLFSPGADIPFCCIKRQFKKDVHNLNVWPFDQLCGESKLADPYDGSSTEISSHLMLLFRKWSLTVESTVAERVKNCSINGTGRPHSFTGFLLILYKCSIFAKLHLFPF